MITSTILSPPKANLDHYEILKNICSNNNIKVKLVKNLQDSTIYVCKLLKFRPVINMNSIRKEFYKEFEILSHSTHKNLIKLIDYSECSSYIKNNRRCYECMYYIMEYCNKGNLLELVTQNTFGLAEEKAKEIFQQIASGINYIHTSGFAHGDIRLENFVISDESLVKIIDFGFLKQVNVKCYEFNGSNYYMAPEILNHQEYLPEKSDIFAAGCALFSLVFGCPAFYSASMTDK